MTEKEELRRGLAEAEAKLKTGSPPPPERRIGRIGKRARLIRCICVHQGDNRADAPGYAGGLERAEPI